MPPESGSSATSTDGLVPSASKIETFTAFWVPGDRCAKPTKLDPRGRYFMRLRPQREPVAVSTELRSSCLPISLGLQSFRNILTSSVHGIWAVEGDARSYALCEALLRLGAS